MQGSLVDEFESSAQWVASVAGEITDEQWGMTGLGAWDVRSLLGHTLRALITIEEYLARPAATIDCPSTFDYLSGASRVDPAIIAARGNDAGVALGVDPVAFVGDVVERVPTLVRRHDPDEVIMTIAGGMTLSSYLPTRTVELIVHGCDLSRAIGVKIDPPIDALRSVVHLLAETYLATGRGATFCLAIAGRPVEAHDLEIWPAR